MQSLLDVFVVVPALCVCVCVCVVYATVCCTKDRAARTAERIVQAAEQNEQTPNSSDPPPPPHTHKTSRYQVQWQWSSLLVWASRR
jgi:hypothetical protein